MNQPLSDHPFSIPLEDLSQDELDKRFNDLMSRFNIARRMQMDPNVLHQIDLLLVSVETEKYRRAAVDDKQNGVILDTDPIEIPTFKGFK
jgi:hypothetical protein